MRYPRHVPGERPSASKLNAPLDAIEGLDVMTGDGFIEVRRTGRKLAIGLSLENLLPRIPKQSDIVIIAEDSTQFATLDQADAGATGVGSFDPYNQSPAATPANERRTVVAATAPLASSVLEQILVDIEPVGSWETAYITSRSLVIPPGAVPRSGQITLQLRAITAAFDIAALTWNNAYGGGSPLTFNGNVVELATYSYLTVASYGAFDFKLDLGSWLGGRNASAAVWAGVKIFGVELRILVSDVGAAPQLDTARLHGTLGGDSRVVALLR